MSDTLLSGISGLFDFPFLSALVLLSSPGALSVLTFSCSCSILLFVYGCCFFGLQKLIQHECGMSEFGPTPPSEFGMSEFGPTPSVFNLWDVGGVQLG